MDESRLPDTLRVTHKSLFDGTLQGMHRTDKAAFSFQGHPEASPGPHDAAPLFDHFIELIAARSRPHPGKADPVCQRELTYKAS